MIDVVVENLSVTYVADGREIEALRDINLTIRESEFVCMVGPSGSGKTTLLNVLAGFVPISRGAVKVGGKPMQDRSIRKGYVFQQYGLFPWLTVAGNVKFALEERGVPASDQDREAIAYLDSVGLKESAGLFPHRLSGGMQQRTAVARALAYDPHLLLLDEPFAALDAFTREKLQALVVDLSHRTHKTFIYVTHNIDEAVFLADRILVFSPRPGRVKADIAVDLPHPRDEHSGEFNQYVHRIRELVEG